jgi:opacity protein-like surface antigen
MWQPKNIRVGKILKILIMRKTLILFVAFIGLIVFNTQAQINVGATVGVQIPTGSMADGMKTGFGFDLLGKYMLNDNLAVGLDVGWARFGAEDLEYEDVEASGSFIPITALAEYHFGTGKVKPFAGIDLGLYIFKAKVSSQGYSVSTSDSYFGFAPLAGIEYDIKDNLAFTANLKYNYILIEEDDGSYLGINVGMIFKLNR